MIQQLFTIGVYGKTEDQFFGKLAEAQIHVFCDIRRRRGVRGAKHAFVNSTYLQKALAERQIFYKYLQNLAPTQAIREAQHALDREKELAKHQRQELGEEFKRRYSEEILARFSSEEFARSFELPTKNVVLFCVEGNPAACHRSLVAEKISADLGIPVEHL